MAPSPQRAPKRPRPSPSSPVLWVLLALWSLAIVYGSLWPWQAWRGIGAAPWAFLTDPLPRFWTWFDFLSNIALYAPLGLLLALNITYRGRSLLWLPALIGGLLSLFIEAAQSYLPQRVPSLLDLLANSLGAGLGGLLALGLRGPWQSIRRISRHWWQDQAQWPAALVILWLAIRISSLLSPKETIAGLSHHLVTSPALLQAGLGLSLGSLLAESLLLSIMLSQVCRLAWVFWLSLAGAQALLAFTAVTFLHQSPSLGASGAAYLSILMGLLVITIWSFWHRKLDPQLASRLGFGLASIWALYSITGWLFASLTAYVEQSSIGPGLGPAPRPDFGLSDWLLSLSLSLTSWLELWRNALGPGWQSLLDLWLGLGQSNTTGFGTTPVLGRSLQHFEAVVFLVQELWRWMCLLWFSVFMFSRQQTGLRAQRRL